MSDSQSSDAARVFISYRIRDSSYAVDRLDERLKQAFGAGVVFRDVRSLPKGASFPNEINDALQAAEVGLVVIGPLWLEVIDADSKARRIDDPSDWVRIEVETLLGRCDASGQPIPVIPVMLGGDRPPGSEVLPDSLTALSSRNGHKLSPDPDFEESVRQLIDHIAGLLNVEPQPFGPTPTTANASQPRIAATKLSVTGTKFVGREQELHLLDEAWGRTSPQLGKVNIVSLIGQGGEGKTALVLNWYTRQAKQQWPNVRRVFDWSFYSQGTSDQTSASADEFFNAAYRWFDPDREVPRDAWQKGGDLATLIAEERTLLILDGLEPLQQPPGKGYGGEFKDPAMTALLRGLAANNPGLCLLTSRVDVAALANFEHDEGPCIRHRLDSLDPTAARGLLRQLGVRGPDSELDQAAAWFHCHAYDLNLLGNYLSKCTDPDEPNWRDIRGWEQRFPILREDERIHPVPDESGRRSGHGRRMLRAYERWLGEDSPALAILRLLGLFDRPAQRELLDVLRTEPVIPGLTDALVGLPEDDWQRSLADLTDLSLITREAAAIDSHPLLREHFGADLRETPDAWRAAHRRLYEHLCETTDEGDQPTLEDLQPLYHAVAHGCHAGLQQQACDDVYYARIKRRDEHYSTRKLGAFGSDLGAVACFYEPPFSHVTTSITQPSQAWLLGEAAFRLQALGRLIESLQPRRAGLDRSVEDEDWKNAAVSASNLSELELTLGEVADAISDAERGVTYADRSGDGFHRESKRTTHANALHQLGRRSEAESLFHEAEQMQADYPLLYSLRGFQYCDLLLAPAEREAWRVLHQPPALSPRFRASDSQEPDANALRLIEGCHAVTDRATQTLKVAEDNNLSLLSIALDHLTLSRAALFESLLSGAEISDSASHISILCTEIDAAVSGLRRAGEQRFVPLGLLTRAWYRSLIGRNTGPESAESDLDEAWEIASRGPMRLHMADIHLYRARLFGPLNQALARGGEEPIEYPWESVEHDLREARELIDKCGYGRRKEELEDAEKALLPPG